MKDALKTYLDAILTDLPDTDAARVWRNELYAKTYAVYDQAVAAGKSPAEAYNEAVVSVGNVSGTIRALREQTAPTPEEARVREPRRIASSVMTAVAVMLYIMSVVPILLLQDEIGVVGMLVCVAVATGLLILRPYTADKTVARSGGAAGEGSDGKIDFAQKDGRFRAICSLLWCLTVLIYLGISFWTRAWYITWVIFPLTACLEGVLRAAWNLVILGREDGKKGGDRQ